jgi:hypothetical protein
VSVVGSIVAAGIAVGAVAVGTPAAVAIVGAGAFFGGVALIAGIAYEVSEGKPLAEAASEAAFSALIHLPKPVKHLLGEWRVVAPLLEPFTDFAKGWLWNKIWNKFFAGSCPPISDFGDRVLPFPTFT